MLLPLLCPLGKQAQVTERREQRGRLRPRRLWYQPFERRRRVGVRLTVIGELQRDGPVALFFGLLQSTNGFLEIVFVFPGDPNGISLDLSLELRELIAHDLADLFGHFLVQAFAQGNRLTHRASSGVFDLPKIQDLG